MYTAAALAGISLLAGASAQGVGTNTAEVHPAMTISNCAAGGVCTTEADQVVLDANWRWTHSSTSLTNCYTGNAWNPTLCPDTATCTKNCVLEGADYSGTYGISASGNALKLGFVTDNASGTNIGSRTYLMDSTTTYKEFKLLNKEFTFDVDVSNLPCGLNGALYFVNMDQDGGMARFPTNTAGAKYGTGYGDSQCPRDLKFIDGQANNVGWNGTNANSGVGNFGSCSPEMDIWEANSISAAYTPHPCSILEQTECTGATCARNTGYCDGDGCDFNSYRMGNTSFYGPGETVDTTKPFTVVTQFVTADGTATGTLSAINRFYVQNGVVIPNSQSTITGVTGNSITASFCDAQKTAFGDTNVFDSKGGLAQMGKAMLNGMVLVMSIWDDTSVAMNWLDSTYPPTDSTTAPGVGRGTCDPAAGVAATVEAAHPGASVTYSNIKFGPIGSTFNSAGTGSGSGTGTTTAKSSTSTAKSSTSSAKSSSTSSAKVSTTSSAKTSTTATAPTGCVSTKYGQCGGIGFSGCTSCASGSTCQVSNPYYSQCL